MGEISEHILCDAMDTLANSNQPAQQRSGSLARPVADRRYAAAVFGVVATPQARPAQRRMARMAEVFSAEARRLRFTAIVATLAESVALGNPVELTEPAALENPVELAESAGAAARAVMPALFQSLTPSMGP